MNRKQPFKRHRFPSLIILSAVRIYLRYPLSYQDVADLLGERGVDVDRSTVWAIRLAGRRGFRKAAVATARKIAVLMLTLWKTETDYQWTQEATA